MSNDDVDTSQVGVKVYLPAYQKAEWVADANRLGMSQSEFVRTMVQAGRRGFGDEAEDGRTIEPTSTTHSADSGVPVGNDTLEERILDVLGDAEYPSWDEIVAAVTDDVESRIEAALERLQADGRVLHSGRNDGYARIEADGN